MGGNIENLAVVAVAATLQEDNPYTVVAVGTLAGEPATWRVGALSWDDFQQGNRPILGNVALLEDGLGVAYFGAGFPAAPHGYNGRAKKVVSNIVQLALFPSGGVNGNRSGQPIVALDTQGFLSFRGSIHHGSPDPDAKSGRLLVSNLKFTPDRDTGWDGIITGFDLLGSVASPMIPNERNLGPERHDMRASLIGLAVQDTSVPRSLWRDGATGEEDKEKASWFDKLVLRQTLRSLADSQTTGEPRRTEFEDASLEDGRITDFYFGVPGVGGVNGSDWFGTWSFYKVCDAVLGPFDGNGSFRVRRREWGFRIVEFDGPDVKRMVLRFETHFQKWNFGGFFARLLANFPGENWTSGVNRYFFSHEQRVKDVSLNRAPDSPSLWIWAVRPREPGQTARALKVLGDFARLVARGKRSVRDSAPISFLPDALESLAGALPWHVTGILQDSKPWQRSLDADPPDGSDEEPDWRAYAKFDLDIRSLEPRAIKDMWLGHSHNYSAETVSGKFSRLVPSTGEPSGPLRFNTGRLSAPSLGGIDSDNEEVIAGKPAYQPVPSQEDRMRAVKPTLRFALDPGPVTHAVEDAGREIEIGAFRMRLSDASGSDGDPPPPRMTLLEIGKLDEVDREDVLDQSLRVALELRVSNVFPAGQDPVAPGVASGAGDTPAPLLFRLAESGNAAPATLGDPSTYVLGIRETVDRSEDHAVELALRAEGVAQPPGTLQSVLVIDPQPFRVNAVRYRELAAARTDETSEVAVWTPGGENGLSWRIRDIEQSVRLIAPPAVIGEAMEKNAVTEGDRPGDIDPDRPAAARIGPLTTFEIDPTFFETYFREPGWNLRRILGYPGQRAPGSRLKSLRFEMAYGMTALVEPRVDVWIAELDGVFGAPVPAIDDVDTANGDADVEHLAGVRALLTAERKRLAVDRLWSGRPDARLKLEDGVSFRLRRRETGGGPETPFRWPVPGDIVPAGHLPRRDREAVEFTFSSNRDDRDSFPGGIPWAFESANILLEVYGTPGSVGAQVEDIHLSSLGGWGGQRGLFALGKSIIGTETTQGRMQRYKLERIGRIGGLWHRAKHVIIYERTVVPPRQFYNRDPIGKLQDEHAGRPVIRKVEEFVEILQPTRRYPENGTSIVDAGCLLGVDFKSRIIRVDSRWGGDVRREGWRVPLWNTIFALPPDELPPAGKINPDDPSLIYPKPQIHCLFAGEDGNEISVEVDQPEKLFFYTSTIKDEGDDTDSWRAVRNVDFLDLPTPKAGKVQRRSEALTDAMLPAEPADPAGWEALTIGLVQDRQAVSITHGRSDGPAAPLRNFTISRSTGVRSGTAAGLEQLSNVSANLRAELDTAVGQALGALEKLDPALNAPGAAKAAATKAKADFKRELDRALGGLSRRKGKILDFKPVTGNLALDLMAPSKVVKRVKQEVEAAVERVTGEAALLVEDAAVQLLQPIGGTVSATLALKDFLLNGRAFNGDTWPERVDPEDLVALIDDARDAMFDFVLGAADDLSRHFEEKLSVDLDAFKRYFPIDPTAAGALADQLEAVREALEKLLTDLGGVNENDSAGKLAEAIEKIEDKHVETVLSGVTAGGGGAKRALLFGFSTLKEHLHDLATRIEDDDASLPPPARLYPQLKRQLDLVRALEGGFTAIDTATSAIDDLLDEFKDLGDNLKDALAAVLDQIFDEMLADDLLDLLLDVEEAILAEEGVSVAKWKARVIVALDALLDRGLAAQQQVAINIAAGEKAAKGVLAKLADEIEAQVATTAASLAAALTAFEEFVGSLLGNVTKLGELVGDVLGLTDVELLAKRIEEQVNELIDGIEDNVTRRLERIKEQAQTAVANAAREAENRARQLLATAQETVTEALGVDPVNLAEDGVRLAQQGSDTLRLIRAVGDPPRTDRLGLNRPEVAYVLGEVDRFVDITPAVSLVNRVSDTIAAAEKAGQAVGSLLEPFGVRLPTGKLAEQILPEELTNLSVAGLLPDMGGLDLQALMKNVGFPELSDGDAVQVTRGFDKATKRAWMEAKIDVPFTESLDVLDFGPVKIVVDDARFTAFARVSGGLNGVEKKVQGRIGGDWRVVSIGQDILTFQRTELFFDDSGKIDFKISPERVVLAEPLEFLTNFLAAAGQGEGLTIEPLMQGNIPSGVAATLDLALPNITAGVFSITDLSLHARFGIAAIPEFELISELSVAKRTAPFTLSVWILNGGGYVTQRLSYRPLAKPRSVLTYTLDVGIVAGVGLFFNFGVVSGGVSLQVGCSIAVTWTTASGGNTTTITVFILARGNVDVAGLVTASIMLLLEVAYDGSVMLGRGTLRLSFKISCFYTLRVNQGVEYQFAGKKKKETNYSESFE